MRNVLVALGSLGSFALFLTACSGGSSSSPTPQAPAAVAVASPSVNQAVSNGTGPTSAVTVTIRVPPRTQPTASTLARIAASKNSNAVRTLANTSPSASIRAAALAQATSAQRTAQSTRKNPAYIAPTTALMELVISSGSTVVFDDTAPCSSSSCTNTFTGVPVGSGYTATLYLYDEYYDDDDYYPTYYLIAAGAVGNVTVTTGTNTPLTITLNGVVASFNLTTTANSLVGDPSQATSYTVTVEAEDFDGNVITSPGVLLDSSFNQITGVTLAQDASDVTPTSTPITPLGNLSFAAVTYNFAGTGTESAINYTATEIAGSQIVQNFYSAGYPTTTQTGTLTIPVTPATLSWTNPNDYPISGMSGSPTFTTLASTNPTEAQLEFPTLTATGTGALGLSETLSNYAGNVTLSDNGECSGIVGYSPGPTAYQTLAASPYVALTTYGTLTGPSNACVITATDTAGRQAILNVDFDQESLTIQSKVRKSK